MLTFRDTDYQPADYKLMGEAVEEMFGTISKVCKGLCYKCRYARACKDIRDLLFTISTIKTGTDRLNDSV